MVLGQSKFAYCVACVVFVFTCQELMADDWPQWMGPNRDGTWSESGIMREFPEGGLKAKWSAEIDGGYSGPAVADGKVFVTDYVTDGDRSPSPSRLNELSGVERVHCYDMETGKELWTREDKCDYKVSYPAGPRVTPLVDGERVYVLGTMGDLRCLNTSNGELIWERDFVDEFKAPVPIWGFAAQPLLHGDMLYCVVGNSGSVAVAFDKMTGKEVWRALDAEEQGYCPPTLIDAGGTSQLLIWHGKSINSLNPQTGDVYWSKPLEPGYAMAIAAPVKIGDYLFAGGQGNASAGYKLASDEAAAEKVWEGDRTHGIGPVNSTPIADGEHFYGIDRNGNLKCLEAATGEVLWQTSEPVTGARPQGSGTAFIVKNDDYYYLFNEAGDLVVAKLTPEEYTEVSRTNLIEPSTDTFGRKVVWSHPAFANQCIFVRNDDKIICYSLASE